MKILFAHDTYYSRDLKDSVYAHGAFPYALWRERFLPHFDTLSILGRDKGRCAAEAGQLDLSSGEKTAHILLPNINSPLKRILSGPEIFARIKDLVAAHDGVIIRGPAEFGMMAAKAARKLGKPYAVEMSGCAFDHTWHHGALTGKLYAPLKYWRARQMVRHADQVIYVTEHFLQRRYPAAGVHQDFASNVELAGALPEVLARRLGKINALDEPYTIGLIGGIDNGLKGLGVALKALGELKRQGCGFHFKILGPGDPARWRARIRALGLMDRVEFCGTLAGGERVLDWLDGLDFYIQPSLHEGLPRALIEAMSRGLPCLASDAGGSGELLDEGCIHRRGCAAALTRKLAEIWEDKDWMRAQATLNFNAAQRYSKDVLAPRRAAFWSRFAELVSRAKKGA